MIHTINATYYKNYTLQKLHTKKTSDYVNVNVNEKKKNNIM